MIKINTFTPQGKVVRKVTAAAENMKASKSIKIGKSGLPYEAPVDNFKERRVIEILNDSFKFNKAKDSVTIAVLNNSKK